jgi:hypothetical protein
LKDETTISLEENATKITSPVERNVAPETIAPFVDRRDLVMVAVHHFDCGRTNQRKLFYNE